VQPTPRGRRGSVCRRQQRRLDHTFTGATPLGHPWPIWSLLTTICSLPHPDRLYGMETLSRDEVVVAHAGSGCRNPRKDGASTRVIPLLHHYPVSTEPEEIGSTQRHARSMRERLIQKLRKNFAAKIVWGSR